MSDVGAAVVIAQYLADASNERVRNDRPLAADSFLPEAKRILDALFHMAPRHREELHRQLGGSVYGNLTPEIAAAFLQRQGWQVVKPKDSRPKATKP